MLKIKHIYGNPQLYINLFYCNDYSRIELSHFINEIDKIANRQSPNDEDARNVIKGEIWEVFSEIFFTAFKSSPRFGIDNYEPVLAEEDYGCDALGINANGDKCVIQDKFKSNPMTLINYDEYCHVVAAGYQHHKIDLSKKATIYIFTSAKDIVYQAKNLAGDSMVFIGRDAIAKEVDKNYNFWHNAFKEIHSTLEENINAYKGKA